MTIGIYRCLIQIFVSDYNRSVDWYRDNLGMELVTRSDKWKSATLRLAGVEYDICQPNRQWGSNWMKAKKQIGGLRGIFFYTKNISETYQMLSAKGVQFIRPPFTTPWGERKAHFIDPDRNEFSLIQVY